MNIGNKTKATQRNSKANAELDNEQETANDTAKPSKSANINLYAFQRIKANGEQPAVVYFLKSCSNCNKKFVTEYRESETCSDDCQASNRIRGGGRYLVEIDSANIADNFNLEEYPRRNETQTIAQARKAEEQEALQKVREEQQKKREEERAKQNEETAKKQKAQERKLKKFLEGLPESIEEAIDKVIEQNNKKNLYLGEHIIFELPSFEILFFFVSDAERDIMAFFPTESTKSKFIEFIKDDIDTESNLQTFEILENFEFSFPCDDFYIYINGLLQVSIQDSEGNPISTDVFLSVNEPYTRLLF